MMNQLRSLCPKSLLGINSSPISAKMSPQLAHFITINGGLASSSSSSETGTGLKSGSTKNRSGHFLRKGESHLFKCMALVVMATHGSLLVLYVGKTHPILAIILAIIPTVLWVAAWLNGKQAEQHFSASDSVDQ